MASVTGAASPGETIGGVIGTKSVTPASLKAAQFDVQPVNVAHYGFTKADVIAALDAAEARGDGTICYFPAGVYEVGTGLSLSGYSVQIRGDGAAGAGFTQAGTVFKASTQTGPVIDFTGWVTPGGFFGKVTHGGFLVVGSGVADATKARSGVRLATMSSATFRDIAVRDTGGPCWEHTSVPGNGVYLCDFERIILTPPISAKTNDVPWMIMDESNGNRFRGFGLRSLESAGDVGISGAIILEGNASFTPHDNLFDGWWVENLHVPTNGTIFHIEANTTILNDIQWFDQKKESGATGTSHFRFVAPAVNNFGGNLVTGLIPGRDPGVATSIDCGIDMQQSRNSVVGIKGYRGTNVILASGVANTHITLTGAQGVADNAAVTDSSGVGNNTYFDHLMRTATWLGTWTNKQVFSGEVELDGALNHDGTTVGLYGTTPVTQGTALTDLGTGGTSTIAQIETAINAINNRLRRTGYVAT